MLHCCRVQSRGLAPGAAVAAHCTSTTGCPTATPSDVPGFGPLPLLPCAQHQLGSLHGVEVRCGRHARLRCPVAEVADLTPVYRMVGTPRWSTAQHPDQQPLASGPPATLPTASARGALRDRTALRPSVKAGSKLGLRQGRAAPGVGRSARGSRTHRTRSSLEA